MSQVRSSLTRQIQRRINTPRCQGVLIAEAYSYLECLYWCGLAVIQRDFDRYTGRRQRPMAFCDISKGRLTSNSDSPAETEIPVMVTPARIPRPAPSDPDEPRVRR